MAMLSVLVILPECLYGADAKPLPSEMLGQDQEDLSADQQDVSHSSNQHDFDDDLAYDDDEDEHF